MASNDEGRGFGGYDNVYLAAEEFLWEADDQQLMLLGPPVTSESETDIETGTETETGIETGAETDTVIETGAKTEIGAETSRAGIEPKAKRRRLPNKLRTTRLVVTEVDDGNFEPNAPEEARACYSNQIGCIIRTPATINDAKLNKIDNEALPPKEVAPDIFVPGLE